MYSQGARAIPALMKLKSNRQPFATPWALIAFTANCQMSQSNDISVEVTALFLIDAIF